MKKRLRIAMFFSSNPGIPDGLLHHVQYLSQELENLGHSVTLFGPNRKSLLPLKNFNKIVKLIELPFFNETIIYMTSESKTLKNPVTSLNNGKKFDLIHIHDPYLPFVSWKILEESKLPIVTTFHTAWDENSGYNIINGIVPLFKEYFKKVKGVIFVCTMGKKRWGKLFAQKIIKKVILNGIDLDQFKPGFNKNDKIQLLFVARIVPRKGLLILLKVLEKLIKEISNFKLTVLGKGPQLKVCKEYVKKNKLKKYVDFTGYVTGAEKIKHYQTADIFCAPYRNEAYGLTLLEAMASGLPIIGFDSNGVKEALDGYPEKDLIVPYKNEYLFKEALKDLIINRDKRQKIRKWLVKKRNSLSWSKMAKETEELYYHVLNPR